MDTSSNTHLTDDSASESESSSGDDSDSRLEVDTLMTDILGIQTSRMRTYRPQKLNTKQ